MEIKTPQEKIGGFLKQYLLYIVLTSLLIFVSYRLFFGKSESVKILENQLVKISKEKDSLIFLEKTYSVGIENLKNKITSDSIINKNLKYQYYKLVKSINQKIKDDENSLHDVNSYSNNDANKFLANYKYTPFKPEKRDN